MKKFSHLLVPVLLIIATIFLLSSCDDDKNSDDKSKTCQHQWVEADCLYPKTCRLCYKTEGEALGHNFIEATCTESKTCAKCNLKEGVAIGHTIVIDKSVAPTCTETGLTEGKHCSVCNAVLVAQTVVDALGHDWGNPTCTTQGSCCICFSVDPDSEPLGHWYDEQGECVFCGEYDPNFIPYTLTADKTTLNLNNSSDVVYITVTGDYVISWENNNENIVRCEWGEWDGYTIPLIFYPVSSGDAFVTVYIKDTDISITINVTVEMPEPTLTFDEIGKEYKYYPSYGSLTYNVNVVNSASYTVTRYSDGTIKFDVELLVANTEYNVSYGYINIDYELYNEDGVCVYTGFVWVDCRYIGRNYVYETSFFVSEPGNYTLVFYDTYN